ncbi:MAG: hypothetical protein K5755_02325 [Clostridiales bacterium]|nr:hypothetical protein [Clostridiales bacterium]
MKLNLRKKEDCAFDMISLGEIMLRLDPGEGRALIRRGGHQLPANKYSQLFLKEV